MNIIENNKECEFLFGVMLDETASFLTQGPGGPFPEGGGNGFTRQSEDRWRKQ